MDDIVNFAIRMSGPPVQHVTRPESLANIKNMNQLFFMYVGDRKGLLWETFYDVASKMQAHAYYYSASADVAKQQLEIHNLPAVFVHKENVHYFYSGKQNCIISIIELCVIFFPRIINFQIQGSALASSIIDIKNIYLFSCVS